MCTECDRRLTEAQARSREAVSASAKQLEEILNEGSPSALARTLTVENWIKSLAPTLLAVVACDTLTDLIMSVPAHDGDSRKSH